MSALRLLKLVVALLLLESGHAAARAELLPIRTYTSADGLPSFEVTGVKADSRGFVWFSMADGLARFDGYGFTTYTQADGLPDRRVSDFIETSGGDYYVATQGGLARFDPSGVRGTERPPFVRVPFGDDPTSNELNTVVEARDGALWCAATNGLYRLMQGGSAIRIDLGPDPGADYAVLAVYQDRWGDMWVGTFGQVRRIRQDGRVELYPMPVSYLGSGVERIFEDEADRLWVCSRNGIAIVSARTAADDPIAFDTLIPIEKYGWITAYLRASDATEWIAATSGLWQLAPGVGVPMLQRVSSIQGACKSELWDVAEDHDGNIWLASACGALRVDWRGFTKFGSVDGRSTESANSIFESRSGDLIVTALDFGRIVERFDGQRFVTIRPRTPKDITYAGWGWGQTALQAFDGTWWLTTGHGVLRYPSADRPETALGMQPERMNLGAEAFRLYEDSHGDVWIARTQPGGLLRWDHSTNRITDLSAETGVGSAVDYLSFAETRGGSLWIATRAGGLLRYIGGRFERFDIEPAAPAVWLRWLYVDDAGRLWIASNMSGLTRVDAPDAEHPTFARYTMADGLASDNVFCITSDTSGRIYVGMPRGADRLDPETGRVKHFTTEDGLPNGSVQIAYRDRVGRLWLGTKFGLARFDPAPDREREPPRAVVTGLRVAGVGRPVSALGEVSVGTLDLGASENSVSVDYLGIGTSLGEELRYQYKLEGADVDWSGPIAERTLTFANLGAGSYRFLVRAVDADGLASLEPAAVAFTIAAPVWRRWWFLLLAASLTFGAGYALYRTRVTRLLEVERVRTRIAADLHDDIGANLTKIAVLSEVANFRLGRETGDESLSAIADISRESVAAMNDIVWAVNPGRDGARDLSRRMRHFAVEAFVPSGVEVQFDAPDVIEATLDDEVRRHVYLVFKEAVNNAVRHSGCSNAEVLLAVDRYELKITVADDGCGFDVASEADGDGLANMQKRAKSVGGTLGVTTAVGCGTTITLTVPLHRGRPGSSRVPRSHERDGEGTRR